MKRIYVLVGSALAIIMSPTAHAQTTGYYIGGAAGIDFAVDAKAKTSTGHNNVEYDHGPAGLLSFGYKMGAFRTELEGAYRTNDVSGAGGAALNSPGGRAQTWSVMLNGLYDIPTGTAFTPYLGGGVGVGFNKASLTGTRPAGSAVGLYDGSDTTFAYQGIAGFSYAMSPNLSLTTDYRYFATTDSSFNSGGAKWHVENSHHVVMAGLRWSFGAPTTTYAAATPEPAARQTSEFFVLFDWNKSNIDTAARDVIAKAAAAVGQTKPNVVLVTGNTDTSGSNAYNQKLSDRRAAAVKQALIRQGVSADVIRTLGKGEDNPYMSTGDGVREHQNRRAVIILRIG
jgi:OmpA-OmpF porin, OOP family